MTQPSTEALLNFTQTLWQYYDAHGRFDLPWRQPDSGEFDPYAILVSELMLQQTQVSRVIPKYQSFLAQFPSVHVLAKAELGNVLVAWQGLGYNRRAKYLWQAARTISESADGAVPRTAETLAALPGIGPNTAGAIVAYAFNEPAIFVETNIRTVYIHHFFANHPETVHDRDIVRLLDQTIDRQQPRNFYWALMDYGSHLKQTVGNVSQRSRGYVRQAPFEGSRRQVRGRVLRTLSRGPVTSRELQKQLTDNRLDKVLEALVAESMIVHVDDVYRLA